LGDARFRSRQFDLRGRSLRRRPVAHQQGLIFNSHPHLPSSPTESSRFDVDARFIEGQSIASEHGKEPINNHGTHGTRGKKPLNHAYERLACVMMDSVAESGFTTLGSRFRCLDQQCLATRTVGSLL
jgi:hypothetical protein